MSKSANSSTTILRLVMFCMVIAASGTAVPLLYFYIVKSSAFTINTFAFEGNQRLSEKTLQKIVEPYIGRPIYGIGLDEITQRLKKNPWVRKVRLRRHPPSRIAVLIDERIPLAQVFSKQKNVLDQDGKFFWVDDKKMTANLPLVTGLAQDNLLHAQKAVAALVTSKNFQNQNNTIDKVQVDSLTGITLRFKNGLEVVLGDDGFEKKWQKLAIISNSLRDKGKELTYAYFGGAGDTKKVAVRFKSRDISRIGVHHGTE